MSYHARLIGSNRPVKLFQPLITVVSLVVAAFGAASGPVAARQLASGSTNATVAQGQSVAQPRPSGPARDSAAKTPTGVLRGRVIDSDTALPLRRVQIRITSNELRESRTVITDARGGYEVNDLPVGRYNVTALKGGYVSLVFGQRQPFEPGRPVEVRAGEVTENIAFSLPRGAALDGRIVDELGEPVTDVLVMAMRSQYVAGRRRLMNIGRTVLTNDRGEYRLFGLPPGNYYVSATTRATGDAGGGLSYVATYQPGPPNLAYATPVSLSLSQDSKAADIALSTVRSGTLSGAAFDSDGRPFVGGAVTLSQSIGGVSLIAATSTIKPDGSFSLAGVTPGDYLVQASAGTAAPGSDASAEVASARVSFSDGDQVEIRLFAQKPISVFGRIIPDESARWSPSSFQLRALPASIDDPIPPNGITWRIHDDWSFEAKLPRAVALFRLGAAPSGAVLKSVMLDGVDVADAGLDLTKTTEARGLEVFLAPRASELTGAVQTRDGTKVADFVVVAFAQDRDRWQYQSRYFGGARADASGGFKIRGLPAGDYFIAAVNSLDVGQASDPEVLSDLAATAAKVSIAEGESKAVSLVLSSRSW
jgi:hypothetical protein